jgi:hypothetical protein
MLVLVTDCSFHNIGASLAEDNSGIVTILCTASRPVSLEEHNLSVVDLEILCINWAYQQFQGIIGQQTVLVLSDSVALSCIY